MQRFKAQINMYGQLLTYTMEAESQLKVWEEVTKKVLEIAKTGVLIQSVTVKTA